MKIKKYLNTKTFRKVLAFGILLNNVPINSFAGILSEDGRYETFEGSSITIPDILEEDKVDVEIEGNTLVNIAKENQMIKFNGSINAIPNKYFQKNIYLNYPLKANTAYTISLNVTKNSYNHPPFSSIALGQGENGDSWSNRLFWDNHFRFKRDDSNIGACTIDFVTSSRVEETSLDHIVFIGEIWDTYDTIIEDICIVEKDSIANNNLKYFEGIKSSFENQLVTQEMVDSGEEKAKNLGKYKVEINSSNKNLFNEILEFGPLDYNGKIGYNYEHIKKATYKDKTRIRCEKLIKVKPNTTYTLHIENKPDDLNFGFQFFDINQRSLGIEPARRQDYSTYTTSSNTFYLNVYIGTTRDREISIEEMKGLQIQIEEGKVATQYEPYKKSINTFYLNSPLLNGDTIEYVNGQVIHVKRSKKIILNGNEDWGYQLDKINDENPMFEIRLNALDTIQVNAISDKFKGYTAGYTWFNDEESISLNQNGHLQIRINRSKLKSVDVEGFKEWIRDNEVTVVYKLATPIYESLNTNLNIPIHLDTTHISTNSNIPANLKVTVDRVANRAKEYSELAKENPTIENISLARMWTNKMRESILKDEFQDNIDNITEITDMTLERKTASSNVDVYIKSENMLSMNLSTNSITFEDFSGVEDMIKENAVNISINSSLPYNLNAYLATDIQNSDKSNNMNKDILSIKDNSELDYQTFNSINDKVVLKSNCNSGNDKQHNVDLKLNGGIAHEKDVYKTTIKFEAEQQ